MFEQFCNPTEATIIKKGLEGGTVSRAIGVIESRNTPMSTKTKQNSDLYLEEKCKARFLITRVAHATVSLRRNPCGLGRQYSHGGGDSW